MLDDRGAMFNGSFWRPGGLRKGDAPLAGADALLEPARETAIRLVARVPTLNASCKKVKNLQNL